MGNKVRQCSGRRSNIVRNFIWTTLLIAAMLLGGASASHAQVSFGIRIGPPPQPRVVRVVPGRPGPEFSWIDGYWYPVGGRYKWHEGYWTRPPYEGARWVGPHHDGQQFYAGYWDGDRGRFEHDHRWDKNHDRDRDRYRDNGGDQGHQDQGRNDRR